MAPRADVPLKKCEACGQLMLRKWYGEASILEQPTRYAKRKYCGNDCKATAYRKPAPRGRDCRQCGDPIRRKVWPCGEVETTAALRRRRFCDSSCAAQFYDERGGRTRFLMRWHAARRPEARA